MSKIVLNNIFHLSKALLYLGFNQEYFASKDIIDYAVDRLEESDDIEVCELAGAQEYEKDHINELLQDLIKQENTQDDLEFRKIRATIASEVLQVKNDNYIDGLMELADLWSGFDFPEDSPHVIQGRGNEIAPQDYYTQENYDMLYQKNKVWLDSEVEDLRENQTI
jgi:hypothetical protein